MELPALRELAPSPVVEALARWWADAGDEGRARCAIAFSGGADSTALLVAQARWQLLQPAPDADVELRPALPALHVHHGLQPAADRFVAHCAEVCGALDRQLPTRLLVTRVPVELAPGASVEAQAREARYAALACVAREQGIRTVLLAQHADDQVETMLIALGRGAGVAGLSGMARVFVRDGVRFGRPLLDVPASASREWLRACDIGFIDDPSNANEGFTRNRLRRRVMPALAAALPDFRKTFARSAGLAFEARQLLEERAREDLDRIGEPPTIDGLRALSRARQGNALRHWLKERHDTIGSQAQLDALLDVLAHCTTRGHRIHIKVGTGFVEREGERLAYRAFL